MKRTILAVLFASAAFAQSTSDQFKILLAPVDQRADVIMRQRLGVRTLNVDGGFKLSPTGTELRRSYQGQRDWDFPALSSTPGGAQTCIESGVITSTGTKIQDFCSSSNNFGVDGGSALPLEAFITCRAATDSTYIKLCVSLSDGGSIDLGDAGWYTLTWGP